MFKRDRTGYDITRSQPVSKPYIYLSNMIATVQLTRKSAQAICLGYDTLMVWMLMCWAHRRIRRV